MYEQFPSPESREHQPVRMEDVLEALVSKGKDSEETKALMMQWEDETYEKIRTETIEPQMQSFKILSFETARVNLYMEAGYWAEALEELEGENGLLEAAWLSNQEDLYDIMLDTVDAIKERMQSKENVLPAGVRESENIQAISTKELEEKLARATASDVENYELAAEIRDELNRRRE